MNYPLSMPHVLYIYSLSLSGKTRTREGEGAQSRRGGRSERGAEGRDREQRRERSLPCHPSSSEMPRRRQHLKSPSLPFLGSSLVTNSIAGGHRHPQDLPATHEEESGVDPFLPHFLVTGAPTRDKALLPALLAIHPIGVPLLPTFTIIGIRRRNFSWSIDDHLRRRTFEGFSGRPMPPLATPRRPVFSPPHRRHIPPEPHHRLSS